MLFGCALVKGDYYIDYNDKFQSRNRDAMDSPPSPGNPLPPEVRFNPAFEMPMGAPFQLARSDAAEPGFNPAFGMPMGAPLNINPPSSAVKRGHALSIGAVCGSSAVVD